MQLSRVFAEVAIRQVRLLGPGATCELDFFVALMLSSSERLLIDCGESPIEAVLRALA